MEAAALLFYATENTVRSLDGQERDYPSLCEHTNKYYYIHLGRRESIHAPSALAYGRGDAAQGESPHAE